MVNNIVVEGRLVKEVELKAIPNSDKVVATGVIACNNYRQEYPDYIKFQVWDKQADYLAKNTTKGTHLLINGRLSVNKYKKDDQWKENIYVNVAEVENLDRGQNKSVLNQEVEDETIKNIVDEISSESFPFDN